MQALTFCIHNPMLHTNTGEFQTKVCFNWRPWGNYIEAQIEGKDSPKKRQRLPNPSLVVM